MNYPNLDLKIRKIYLSNQQDGETGTADAKSTDVIVLSQQGRTYAASFYTFDGIEDINHQNKKNGSFMGGFYFWDKNMVLVENCTSATVEKIVKHMIDEGEFLEAFRLL